MSFAKTLVPLAGTLLFAAGAQAQVQGAKPPYVEYAAKFTCGTEAKEADDVVSGVYASSINIHNPQFGLAVNFFKKIVVANREGPTPLQPKVLEGGLKPDLAERVDCIFIRRALGNLAAGPYVEGFVVIEVPPVPSATGSAATVQPVLDVVAKYTARAVPPGSYVTTQSVVQIDGKRITN